MKETRKERKRTLVGLVGLCAAVLIGSTFAYWSQTSTVENPFDTGKYGSTIREDFKPADGESWQPGVEVNKDVMAINTGDTDLLVRVKLEEVWARSADATADPGEIYKQIAGTGVYTTSQNSATDGLTALDGSVVEKNMSASTKWIDGQDGWYYYSVNLAGGETSDKWLDSVELIDAADMGKLETRYYVSVTDSADESTWVWVEYTGDMPKYLDALDVPCDADEASAQAVLHNKTETSYAKASGTDLLGYSQSDYTLTVTLQTIQATQEAIDAVFGGGSPFSAPAGTAWNLA